MLMYGHRAQLRRGGVLSSISPVKPGSGARERTRTLSNQYLDRLGPSMHRSRPALQRMPGDLPCDTMFGRQNPSCYLAIGNREEADFT